MFDWIKEHDIPNVIALAISILLGLAAAVWGWVWRRRAKRAIAGLTVNLMPRVGTIDGPTGDNEKCHYIHFCIINNRHSNISIDDAWVVPTSRVDLHPQTRQDGHTRRCELKFIRGAYSQDRPKEFKDRETVVKPKEEAHTAIYVLDVESICNYSRMTSAERKVRRVTWRPKYLKLGFNIVIDGRRHRVRMVF